MIMPRDVIELHRGGVVLQPDETKPTDLTLDALLEEGLWRATAPVVALLDPLAMSLVLQNTAGLQFDHVTDTAGASPATLGLDPPMMTFELGTVGGETVRMHFGPKGTNLLGMWNGTLAGDPLVWSMAGSQALALAADVTELFDRRLHRFPQGEIDGVQLSTPEREVRLEKNAYGWTVVEARAGSRVFGPARTADPRRVADLLTALDRVEFRAFALDAPFEPQEKRGAVHVRARDASAGGTIGADHATGGVRFQRDGETLVGVVEESLIELVRTSAQDLWSTTVIEIPEVEATRLVLLRGEREIVYERDRYGVWVMKGRTNEARELHAVLDPLLFLRASRHLESTSAALEDPIELHWHRSSGELVIRIGVVTVPGAAKDGGGASNSSGDAAADPAGAVERLVVVDHDGRRSVLQRQDLHELLVRLFEGG
jgi:hypothetical protein